MIGELAAQDAYGVDPMTGAVIPNAGAQDKFNRAADAVIGGVAFPGNYMKAFTPEQEGKITEGDVFRQDTARRQGADWAAGQALGMTIPMRNPLGALSAAEMRGGEVFIGGRKYTEQQWAKELAERAQAKAAFDAMHADYYTPERVRTMMTEFKSDNPVRMGDVANRNTTPLLAAEEARAPNFETPPARNYTRRYAPAFEMGGDVNAGLDAPTNRLIQTVRDPHRMMFPGVYANPREIAAEAARHVVPENPAMQQLWGVSRGDLDQMAIGRVGNEAPKGVKTVANPNGSEAASNIMTPRNEARLQDALYEAGRIPGLKHADAWYIMDPVYQRLEQMFGPQEAVQRFRHLNTMMGMASPSSPVLQEIQRGTAAHWLQQQGRWDDVLKQMPLGEPSRGANFPDDLRYIKSHLHFRNASAEPMDKYLQRGELLSDKPKVPLYVHASGVPETGFQTSAPVGDAHWSRSVGLADTREGPSNVGAAFTRPEYQQLAPWWRDKIAAPLGIESVPAQARMWTAMGPQTGIDSPLGAGKLELFSQQIMKAAKRLNVSPETARDLILSGGAGAGALMLAPKIGDLAAPDRYSN
jgi:hypothetical protein